MFVGETGILRVVDRTAELMAASGKDHPDDVRGLGAIDLPTIQRYLNLWFSVSLDLFGGEVSSNAAASFASGLKGRANEARYPDHRALEATYPVEVVKAGRPVRDEVPLRNALNEVLRDAYVEDCQRGVDKWNRAIAARGVPLQLVLPHRRFHRKIGVHADLLADPSGNVVSEEVWRTRRDEWLPSVSDRAFVQNLMRRPALGPQEMASWIAPPRQGIKGRPVAFEYVRRDD